MAYACGDCYPQFRVDSILYPNESKKALVEQDVYLVYKNNGRETPLEQMVDSCWICYQYRVDGQLVESFLQTHKTIVVTKYELKASLPDCCVPTPRLKTQTGG
jgi:hypothetical protein